MEIRRFCNAIFRKLWLIIILGVLGGGISFYLNYYNSIPMYEATTTIFTVTTRTNTLNMDNDDERIKYEDILISREFEQDFQDIMMSENVIANASDKVKSQGIEADDLIGTISLSSGKDSNIIRIIARCDSPKKSLLISKAVSSAFIEKLNEITKTKIVGILDEAKEPLSPIQSSSIKQIVIGVIAGLIIAFLIIYIMELFDSKIRSIADIEYNLKLQVLTQIPKYGTK